MAELIRCEWLGDSPPEIYVDYHDNEWGRPVHDDNKLFEMIALEGMQAGLSWLTVLKKRENFRKAFDNFDVEKVASYDEEKITELLQNEGIIRNKLKVNSTVRNAQLFLEIQDKYGSFDKMIWDYVENKPMVNSPKSMREMAITSPISDKISKDLKKLGFNFVGSTIIYAFMQATGMVNDHTQNCYLHGAELK